MAIETNRTVYVKEWGFEQPVILKRINGADRANLMREMATIPSIKAKKGQEPEAELIPGAEFWNSDVAYVVYCLKAAPFITDPTDILQSRKELGAQDWELIDYLNEQAEDLNRPFVMKDKSKDSKKDSNSPSSSHPTMQN